MGLALKDSPPGFVPSQVVGTYGTDEYGQPDFSSGPDDDDQGFAETEQL
jgi:DNA-directed RNA polymerase subunit alpha